MAAVPEELRCKRSDGKQWRCSAPSMPDKTVCEKHYVQAKKRSASSALRATLRRSSGAGSSAFPLPYAARLHAGGGADSDPDADPPAPVAMAIARPLYGRVAGETVYVAEPVPALARRVVYDGLPLGNAAGVRTAAELVGRGSERLPAGGVVGLTSCHQCRKVGNAIWCVSCDRRGYCADCISRWYSDIPVDDVQKVCPACRGICNCRVCLQGDNLIKARVQEISVVDKLRYLHSLLVYVLPVLKQIYSDQCFEIGVETRCSGPKTDILRAKVNSDEQMCCDFCKVPVFDYHRHCPKCLYDLCLDCCRDIRRSRANVARGEYTEGHAEDRSKDSFSKRARLDPYAGSVHDKSFSCPIDLNGIRSLFPTWRANNNGSITCGPHEAGGCGSSKLVLRRIFKINWIAKLVKSSEEMVNGCKVHDLEDGCLSCNDGRRLELTGQRNFGLSKCSSSDDIYGNHVYSPVLNDLKYEGIIHFRKHWVKGEPIVIRKSFEPSLSSSWDPLSIWRGIQEIMDEKMDEDVIVKAVDCSSQSEVDIELNEFIKGYSDGSKGEDGHLLMLKLKEWPLPGVLEEFLLCQRPEFIVNFPLVDFIHPRWGFLNLAAKLPPDALPPEAGMKLLVAYGSRQDLGKSDSVMNLRINMGDVVHMLMHTAEVHDPCPKMLQPERSERIANGTVNAHAPVRNLNLDMGIQAPEHTISKSHEKGHVSMLGSPEKFLDVKVCRDSEGSSADLPSSPHCEESKTNSLERSQAGALWDVFRRQDLPKLNEYLAAYRKELAASSQEVPSVKHHIYDQVVYLNNYHKKKLKDQFGIEPWTFRQHVSEAVFIPAGCPFQVKNLQSTVQLALDFLSPESLPESVRMAQEIRCLPNGHAAKLKMLEIRKISLYAASSAVREIQRITLDPKFSLDIRFEDQNLTRVVSENLARVNTQKKVSCI
ncbi:E3 ubiquitin-protein ligase JMJ24 isoform X2 [Phragmites australis]|uniref:E3 ubiquitin-protein ligase JMJ24 isoform X2 n=1 Tax=Phragmites australis TaxID=29695 RepID=UPI002D78361B|nr:E3 ubiquitin-protein ligase JMJ24 isoform X2 [Phragmites australis]